MTPGGITELGSHCETQQNIGHFSLSGTGILAAPLL
jgi:hypothetical protein